MLQILNRCAKPLLIQLDFCTDRYRVVLINRIETNAWRRNIEAKVSSALKNEPATCLAQPGSARSVGVTTVGRGVQQIGPRHYDLSFAMVSEQRRHEQMRGEEDRCVHCMERRRQSVAMRYPYEFMQHSRQA